MLMGLISQGKPWPESIPWKTLILHKFSAILSSGSAIASDNGLSNADWIPSSLKEHRK